MRWPHGWRWEALARCAAILTSLTVINIAADSVPPASASVLNTCQKVVTVVAVNPSNDEVTVEVKAHSSCPPPLQVDPSNPPDPNNPPYPYTPEPPFAGEFVTVKLKTDTSYDDSSPALTDATGHATVKFAHSSSSTADFRAKACATHPAYPGNEYYCAESPP